MSSLRDRSGVFISYRREDTAAYAGRLYDRLSERFGEDRVFMDVDSIAIGVDFTKAIIEAVSRCNILLVLIGRDWPAITDSKGKRRIDDRDDFVRVEIETALQRDIRVVPVLVDGATLPQANELPLSLRSLVRRQALELSHTGFRSQATRLIAAVDNAFEDEPRRPAEAPSAPSPAGQQSPRLTGTSPGSKWTAEVLTSTRGTRTLRIRLSNDVHILTVRIRPWSDTVQIDDIVIIRTDPLKGSYSFEIEDGGRPLPAEISVLTTASTQKITKLSLTVMGRCLYSY